jgi:sortase (surface protein transpeptidase)
VSTPAPPVRRTRDRRRHVPALLLLAAILVSVTIAARGSADATPPDPGYAVVATTPTTDLTDGQPVTINVKAQSGTLIFGVTIRQCRADTTYTSPADLSLAAGKCASQGVSTSGNSSVGRSDHIIEATQTTTGASLSFRVGVGTARTNPPVATSPTISCNPAPTPQCVLVVQVNLANSVHAFPTIPLGISDARSLTSCGGPAPGIVQSAGSDQLQDAWAKWTQGACQAASTGGAPTSVTFGGEGLSVIGFADGKYDLAYTSAGFDPAVGLVPAAAKPRAAVAVPIALDAAVVAAGGGENRSAPFWDKPKYSVVNLTAGQAAALFAGTLNGAPDAKYAQGIRAENPDFGGHISQDVPAVAVQAAAEAESSSWFLTNYFKNLAPDDWIAPGTNAHRGASAAFGTADPPFPELGTYSGRTTLQKVVDLSAQNFTSNGAIWAATDLATAKALGLTPVSLANANGDFVTPTSASMAAAVATMKPDANGMLIPDPTAVASTPLAAALDTVEPYPLTYVVYALVPAEALVDPTTCGPATASQTLLTKWLTYLTTGGQQNLPAGLEPLPASLRTAAATAIPKVGANPFTGTCVPTNPPTPPPPAGTTGGTPTTTTTATSSAAAGSGPAAAGASASRSGSGSRSSNSANLVSAPAVGSLDSAANAPGATKPNTTILASVPAFAGHKLADTTDGMLALIGIVVVTSLAAWVTAGQSAGGASVAGAGGGTAGVGGATAGPKAGPLVGLWLAVAVASFGLVVYQLGPVLQQRDQRSLLSQYRVAVGHAAAESGTVKGVQVSTKPPEPGTAVGVLEIGALETQKVVVEGVSPTDTEKGSGHVPGTAGLGQPGNSVVVARRNAYGGSFGDLSSLRTGQKILVTTTQGQSVYSVCAIETRSVHQSTATDTSAGAGVTCAATKSTKTPSAATTTTAAAATATTATAAEGATKTGTSAPTTPKASASGDKSELKAGGRISSDALYGPSRDNRLTLVTSASRAPWNSSSATVVVATMIGKPFAPTPQGARSDSATGQKGDSGVWAAVVLVLLLWAAAVAASVMLYRRMRFRVAYILTIAPLVALTVIAGGTLSRLLPAWT